ncbi:putative membrane protein YjcC [compost metagenome]
MTSPLRLPSTHPQPAEPPVPSGRAVQLLLWFPMRIERAIVPYLEHAGVSWARLDDGLGVKLVLPDARVGPVCLGLAECLSPVEAATTKALRLAADQAPQLADLAKVSTLRHLALLHQSRWLSEILARNQLTSHFQPIVHAQDTSRIFAHEALLRAQDAHGNPVPPLRLIQAARETNNMRDLELQAQRAALKGMTVHAVPTTVFVNVNPTCLGEAASALDETVQLIDRLGIPHQQVVFEIVEMDSIADVEAFGRAMRAYKEAGFRFALDDLGSGYSGLNLVHQLRPDFIKLDMALVRHVHQDAYKAVITQMVIELARRLGLKTIAEGVEHLGELAWLRENGVDFVQGYLIAKPCSPPATSTPAIGDDGRIAAVRISQAS